MKARRLVCIGGSAVRSQRRIVIDCRSKERGGIEVCWCYGYSSRARNGRGTGFTELGLNEDDQAVPVVQVMNEHHCTMGLPSLHPGA